MASTEGSGHLSTDELFRRHAPFVARFLARLGVPSGQLEDALQEVFLVAHRNGGYRPGLAKPTSYLASIALRAAARHRHRDGVARTRFSEAPVEQLVSEDEDPARAVQVRQDLERLQHALAKLPEDLCTTLLLVEVEGESCVSVAAGLGCPVGTIYWRLHRARKQLRSALGALPGSEAAPSPRAAHGQRVQPVRSWMFFIGLDRWADSEASRLLQLAREQPAPALPFDALVARHHELIQRGAELPTWASGMAPHSASWLTLLGGGPIAVGALGLSVAAVALLAMSPFARDASPPASEVQVQVASAAARPARPLADDAPAAAVPEAAQAAELDEPEPRPAPSVPARKRTTDREREHDLALADEVETTPEPSFAALERGSTAPKGKTEAAAEAARDQEKAQPAEPAKPSEATKPKPPIDDATAKMGRVVSDAELAEMQDIARAERLLSDDPARALALTRAMQAGIPNSRFGEERSYLEVMALHGLGRTSEARAKATTFLRAYPAGLYSDRVRKAVAGEGR